MILALLLQLIRIMKKNKLATFEQDSELILRELERNYLQVLTTLGYGTFGRVKLVKFRGKSEVYALKIMRKQEILEQNQLMHLHSQKEALLQVHHPNIVALKSTFQDPKHIYMMFEYIQGGELFARLTRNGRFNDQTAMFYVAGVLDAICHLHTKDIVFRDLKPENIMVDYEGFPKLIDLGFAKKLNHVRTFTICGTPEYLAPEMLQKTNKSGYGKQVDYWGIGILVYELLAGYPPFYDNDEPRNIYKKILKGVIQFPEFFSLRAKHLILSLLNPNPQRRLGARNNGEDIKKHPWFRKFDWSDIRNGRVPWKPQIKDPHDATNFEQVSASRGTTVSIAEQDQNLFEGF